MISGLSENQPMPEGASAGPSNGTTSGLNQMR